MSETPPLDHLLRRLSVQEAAVLARLEQGWTEAEIGVDLHLSSRMVAYYLNRAARLMDTGTRAKLLILWGKAGGQARYDELSGTGGP